MKYSSLLPSFIIFLTLVSCQQTRDNIKKDYQKTARGEADEMVLVIDSAVWNRPLGDELKSVFKSYIIGLPQDEAKFNVHTVDPLLLNSTLKTATNMVFVMTLDNKSKQGKGMRQYFSNNSLKLIQKDTSIFMTVRKDEFAKGQVVLYLFSDTEDLLIEKIQNNKDRLLAIFESAVRERTRKETLSKLERTLMKTITEDHGYSIQIPFGWDIAKNLKDFVWLRNLEAQSELNVFIHERPYTDQEVFDNIAEFRDEITETYLRDSEKPELYITRQEQVPVFTNKVSFNNRFTVLARGLWKNSDISGGGPFVSYTLVDESTQTLYYVEGYVYSPGTKKKKLVRKVEAILSTFRTPSDLATAK